MIMKRKLETNYYNTLRNMDFSLINNDISFDDENCIFETDAELFDAVFDDNIVAYGMDSDQENCNEYGRTLYMLYDLLFFSDYGKLD